MPDLADHAHDLAVTAIRTLEGRKGFDWWWDSLDEGIQDEIREALVEAFLPHLRERQSTP
jgi:hypothetical protein